MNYAGLDLSKACNKGWVMAVYKTGMEFGEWNGFDFPWKKDRQGNEYQETDLLELHIFDEEKEYRAVRSVKKNGGFIESVIDDTGMIRKHKNNENVETQKVENDMYLFGEEWVSSDDNSFIVKESGREKKLYISGVTKESYNKTHEVKLDDGSDKEKHLNVNDGIFLKVIDYYDFDENMLMYLSGYRMAGLKGAK